MINLKQKIRKKKTILIILFATFCIVMLSNQSFEALESTAHTYTLSYDMRKQIRTQDAFLPAGIYLKEAGLNNPEDLFYNNGKLYIADSGNERIVEYELSTGKLRFLGAEYLKRPTGVAVGEDGRIYIADYQAAEVVVMSHSGNLLQRITRPEDVFYGNNPYKPKKVDFDGFGNIFVVSEGSNEGVLQFNQNGEFSGFFGANKAKPLSLTEWFQKVTYSDEQKAKMFFRTPPNIVNLATSNENLIFTVTQNDKKNAIKKINMAGINIFAPNSFYGSDNYVDVAVSKDGFIYAVTQDGYIDEFDPSGLPVHSFGGRATTSDRNGLTAVAIAIEIDEKNNLYVLDKERGVLQVWYPTDYSNLHRSAEAAFKIGDYKNALGIWDNIMQINPTAYFSHAGYAKTLFQLGRYKEAAVHYERIFMSKGYSDCYWEIRSEWLRSNMKTILILFFSFLVLVLIDRFLQKKYAYRKGLSQKWAKIKRRVPLVRHLISDSLHMIRHPVDGVYYLKRGEKGSFLAAGILYIVAYLMYMICRALTPFIFGGGFGFWNDPVSISIIIIIPIMIFVPGSYLISSINDGEGTLKQSFITMGYSFAPFIFLWPLLTILSFAMTLTELFTYSLLKYLIMGYTGLLLFISIKETHMYDIKKTISNVFLTLAFMIIAVIAATILYIFWRELSDFSFEIIEEVNYRVFS